MRVSKIIAGLGNQLFTYAFYKQVEKKCGGEVYVDLGWFDYKDRFAWYPYQLDNMGLTVNAIGRKEYCVKELYMTNHGLDEEAFERLSMSVPILNLYKESNPYACDELWNYDDAYYMGNFQNIGNLDEVIDDIRNTVVFDYDRDYECNEMKKRIVYDENSVSVHVRLNDYPNMEVFEQICTIEYYVAAIKQMLEINSKSVFYIFSNNIQAVKKRLPVLGRYVYVDFNDRNHGLGDMELMTLCRNNIIPNSTFGWWGAVLNKNINKIVISPDNFDTRFRDVNRDDMNMWFDGWIRITV